MAGVQGGGFRIYRTPTAPFALSFAGARAPSKAAYARGAAARARRAISCAPTGTTVGSRWSVMVFHAVQNSFVGSKSSAVHFNSPYLVFEFFGARVC